MAQGFRGNAAKRYFATISTALERASMLSGTPAAQLPDGETGGYQLETGNSSNIVIIDEVYHHGISMMTDADIEMESKLRYVITRLEDVCHTLFKMSATTAKIEELLGELKAHMNGYRDHSIEARRITQGYMIQMNFYDQGETRVYNDYAVREYIRVCTAEIKRQISALDDKKHELTMELHSSQNALTMSQSLLERIISEQSVNSLSDTAQMTNLSRGVSNLQTQISSIISQIREIEECVDYLSSTLHKANSTIEDLLENVQSVDRSYALDIEALNDWTQQYINRMREIGDSIGGVMQSAVTGERIGILSCPATLDTLLEALEIFEERDRTAILEIIADGPKLFRNLLFMFADKINIVDIDYHIAGFTPPDTRLADGLITVFSEIRLNVADDREDGYVNFFHEIGHLIDFYITKEWLELNNKTNFTSSESKYSQILYDAMRNDVERYLRKVTGDIAKERFLPPAELINMTIYEVDEVIEIAIANIMAGNKVVDAGTIAEELQKAIHIFLDEEFAKNVMNPVSDLIGGYTNNAINEKYGHFDPNYWVCPDGQPTGAHQQEFWAHYYSSQIRRCDESLQNMEQYLAEGFKVLEDIVSEIESLKGGKR
ncbi:MAG: hypothetical protein LBC96_03155 [Lachnospiraceae bacterium]|jgi:hypothetical protein|nr:hypothetical protein [Lachnospiraceae bacterium]